MGFIRDMHCASLLSFWLLLGGLGRLKGQNKPHKGWGFFLTARGLSLISDCSFLPSLQMVSCSSVLTAISKVRTEPCRMGEEGGKDLAVTDGTCYSLLTHIGLMPMCLAQVAGANPAWARRAGSEEPISVPSWMDELGGQGRGRNLSRLGHTCSFLPQFDDFSRDLCVQALLDIMDMFCDRLR